MQPSSRFSAVAVVVTLLALTTVGGVATADTSLATANETVRVHGTADATVGGTTSLDPGRELTVRLRSTAETNPRFFKSDTTTVAADGTFAVQFDLSDYSAGDTFTVAVLHNGTRVAETDGRVVPPDMPTTMVGTATPDTVTASESPSSPSTAPGTETATPVPGFGPVVMAIGVGVGIGVLRRRA